MTEWREISLGDACVRLRSGSNITAADIQETGDFPVFGGNGIRGYSSESNFSGECAIIGRQGAYCGNVRFFRGTARMSEHAIVACANPQNNTQFLAYLLSTLNLGRLSGQAAQPGLSVKVLAQQQLLLPPLETQMRIASVVNVIDDLIANNQRRAELLAKMTRAVYGEWFVKFRYPGHEDVPLIDTALGPIPKGWSVSTCGAELKFIGGGTPSKSEPAYWDAGTVAWYTPTDLTKTGWRYGAAPELKITELGVAKSSARVFPAGSVMMTSRATLGVLAIATTSATTNQGFIVIMPDDRWSPGYIYEWLDSKADDLAALGTGATFREITKGSFKNFPFVVPDALLLDRYRCATEPIEQQVSVLEQQIRNLTNLREVLLPKLVTGQIDLSGLEFEALLEGEIA